MSGRRVPAVQMRGGNRRGVFFHGRDLPQAARERDALLLRVLGSPDPHGTQIDGLGGGHEHSSRVVVVTPSLRDDCDVDYLSGVVALDRPEIDWSGSCSKLLAAVGPFALAEGLVPVTDGVTRVRIWQSATGRRVDAYVPVRGGDVLEAGNFVEEGVAFPGAEIRLEFLEASDPSRPLLPTGQPQDELDVAGLGRLSVSLLDAGEPTVFLRASALGLSGRELPAELERDRKLPGRLEAVRAAAAQRLGLDPAAAGDGATRGRAPPATPRVCWVARPVAYRSLSGAEVPADRIDLIMRRMSAGKLAATEAGAGLMALGAAAALPGTVLHEVARTLPGVATRVGLPSGAVSVEAEVSRADGVWGIERVTLSRSARRLMSGWVHVPSAGMTGAA